MYSVCCAQKLVMQLNYSIAGKKEYYAENGGCLSGS